MATTLLTAASGLVARSPTGPEAPLVVVPPAVSFTNADVGLGRPDQVPQSAGMPIRISISWWGLQDRPDWPYNWTRADAEIGRAGAAGMKILLLVTYAPPWTTGKPTDKWFPPPEFDGGWAAFVDAVVRRYGDRVRAYEVWNEPNPAMFGNYGDGSDLARMRRYWDLVRLTHRQIKADCPACLVVAGGSATGSRPAGQPAVPESRANPNSGAAWLDWAFRNGYGDDFDAVSHHPYPRWTAGPAAASCGRPDRSLFGPAYRSGVPYQRQCGQLAALRAVLVDHGRPDRQIWGTEWGYPTASHLGGRHPSVARIRDYDVEAVRLWRGTGGLGPLFLYQFQDSCARPSDPECHYGIVDRAGRPKQPLYSDLLAAVSARSASSGK